jgi:hypothetical protein
MPKPDRRFLVMVRAGDRSLHRRWLMGGKRTWDLIVSWYGNEPYVPVADERVIPRKGWKLDILADHFVAEPELLKGYDYVWLPDDDLDIDADGINLLFEVSERYGLEVSQPGLTADSYFSFIHTLRSQSFLLRYTDFVESMAPCFSSAALERALPYFAQVPSGWGLGQIWPRLEEDNYKRAAIIDLVHVRHTRPVGVFLQKHMTAAGQSPAIERGAILASFGLEAAASRFHCYAGIGKTGVPRGRFATALHMFIDYLVSSPRWVQPRAWRLMFGTFRRAGRGAQLSRVRDGGG